MRIGFFTDSYLPNIDGVVATLLGYKRELARRGHKAFVFTSGTRSDRELNRDPSVFYYDAIPFPAYPA